MRTINCTNMVSVSESASAVLISEQSALGSLVLVYNHSLSGVHEKKRWKKCEKEVRDEKG